MKLTRKNSRILALATVAVAPLTLIGCSSGPTHAGDIDAIRWDPSPAMHTLSQRGTDRWNMHTKMRDTDFRNLSSDIDRMFFVDRPSRLHPGIKP